MKRLRRLLSATKLKYWYVYGLFIFTITTTILSASILVYSHDGTQAAKQRIYESSLWNALQFQLQSYRFLNYLVQIKPHDLPLNGAAYAQYDLLMSRVDLLRNGEVGYLIRGLTGGRTVRLLNIITGDLELISLNLSKIEGGDLSYLPDMVDRLKRLDNQVNEFTVLVSQGTNKYIARQRRALGENLDRVRILMVCFLASLFALCLCIAKGFSDFRRNQKNNDTLSQDIENVHEEKAKLLTLVSKETRPAIQALLGLAHETKDNANSDNKQVSANIREAANELSHTIDMFNDLALLDTHKLTLLPTTESLEKNVSQCLQAFAPRIQKKGLKLISYIDPSLPDMMKMDFKRVREIILELIQNAITHTPEGSISIQIRPSSMTTPEQHPSSETMVTAMLQIAVKDTGVGLEYAVQQNLRTSPLRQMKQQTSQENEAGLGLFLCYRLVQLMKGEMHFSSKQNSGTEFWIDIPYQVEHNQSEKTPYPRFHPPKRALIFSHDSHLVSILRLQLSELNIESGRASEHVYQEDKSLDFILVLDDSLLNQEMENNIQQWKKDETLVLYDASIKNHRHLYQDQAQAISFPLTQAQLNAFIQNQCNP